MPVNDKVGSKNKLIEKGFKYNLPEKGFKNTLETLRVDVRITLNNTAEQKYAVSKIIKSEFMKHDPRTNMHLESVNSVLRKTRSNNIISRRADKGNTGIVMKGTDYTEKTLNFIESGKYTK